jgi:hypothetical protein
VTVSLVEHERETLAAGQVAEFKVWSELVRQSGGGLHVFLPLRDMGIDGVLHRRADGAYFPIQVKGRQSLTPARQVHITVTASSLVDDDALLIATLVEGDRLGDRVLVVDEASFRRLAVHDMVAGREFLTAAFSMEPTSRSRWAPFLVSRDRLSERFGGSAGETYLVARTEEAGVDRGQVGFLGEAEVVRRLAESATLNLFRPFPDLETVEVLARDVNSRRFLGLQVKTSSWDESHLENRVYVRRSSFGVSPTTYLCVLGWDRSRSVFEDTCLLIPSGDVAGLARVEGEFLVLELQPGSTHHRRLDAYRVPLATLAGSVQARIAQPVPE